VDWAVFGLVATNGLTAVMISAQLAGQTRLDLPLTLGQLATECLPAGADDPMFPSTAGEPLHAESIGQPLRSKRRQIVAATDQTARSAPHPRQSARRGWSSDQGRV
jgi:hypothetical protein